MVNKRVWNAVLGCNLKNKRMMSVNFQGKPFNITLIQAYAPKSNAEEVEVEWFYEDLWNLLELTPKKDVLFIIRDWNAKIGSQETPEVTGKFVLGMHNEAEQRLIEFSQEHRKDSSALKDACLGKDVGYSVILNGLPWKRTEIILSFLRLHPGTAFWTLLLTMMATAFLQKDSCPQ